MPSNDSQQPEEPASSDPFGQVTQTVREEPLLWPVAVVVWLVLCTFGGFLLFYAVRLRSLMAGMALIFVIFFTVWGADQDIRERKLSGKNVLVLSLWAGSALMAFALDRMGA